MCVCVSPSEGVMVMLSYCILPELTKSYVNSLGRGSVLKV